MIEIALVSNDRPACIHIFELRVLNIDETAMIVEFNETVEFVQEVQELATLIIHEMLNERLTLIVKVGGSVN